MPDPAISAIWTLRRLFHSYNSHFWLQPKRKGNREKLLLTSRRIRTHLASREEAESRARSLFSQTSLVVYATAIRVPVIFSGNVMSPSNVSAGQLPVLGSGYYIDNKTLNVAQNGPRGLNAQQIASPYLSEDPWAVAQEIDQPILTHSVY
jgi:hypothetical protein